MPFKIGQNQQVLSYFCENFKNRPIWSLWFAPSLLKLLTPLCYQNVIFCAESRFTVPTMMDVENGGELFCWKNISFSFFRKEREENPILGICLMWSNPGKQTFSKYPQTLRWRSGLYR